MYDRIFTISDENPWKTDGSHSVPPCLAHVFPHIIPRYEISVTNYKPAYRLGANRAFSKRDSKTVEPIKGLRPR